MIGNMVQVLIKHRIGPASPSDGDALVNVPAGSLWHFDSNSQFAGLAQ
jgi:hypothetical protein